MKHVLYSAILMSLVFVFSVAAEDDGLVGRTTGGKTAKGDKDSKDAGSRSASRDKAEPVNNAIGTLSEKPASSKVEHLVAVLKMEEKDRSLNLLATGNTADKLTDLAKKGAKVHVFGEGTEDGTGMHVRRVENLDEKADKGDKGEKKKKKKNSDDK